MIKEATGSQILIIEQYKKLKSLNSFKADFYIRCIILLCYGVLTSYLAFHHEPWRDEADNWLMARDASLKDIFRISADSGTPPLWYYLLKPLALGNLSFWTQRLLHLIIAWGSAYLILFRSPFPTIAVTAILFGYFFSFEYSVVARNYALGIFGLFLYSSHSSFIKLSSSACRMVAFICMAFSSVHFLLVAAACLTSDLYSFFCERDQSPESNLLTLGITASIIALAIICLWPSGNGQFDGYVSAFDLSKSALALVLSVLHCDESLKWDPFLRALLVSVIWVPFGKTLSFRLDNPNLKTSLFFIAALSALVYLFSAKYFGGALRHAGVLFVLAISALWQGMNRGGNSIVWKRMSIFFTLVIFSVNFRYTVNCWTDEIFKPFTDAEDTAEFITSNGYADSPISCHPAPNCSSVLVRLGTQKNAWYPGLNSWGSFMLWDKNLDIHYLMSVERALTETRKKFFDRSSLKVPMVLFLAPKTVSIPEKDGIELVHVASQSAWRIKDEGFNVYVLSSPE